MTQSARKSLRAHFVGGLIFATALLGAAAPVEVQAGGYRDGRTESGARLFRAMVAADTEIERKADLDGSLKILIVHAGDVERATALGELVAKRDEQKTPEPIKGLPVRVELWRADEVAHLGKRTIAAIFMAEALKRDQLQSLIRLGAERHVVVYSPFEGDVEKGVSGGLSIEAQVRPFVNTTALRAAQVTLKEFFLKVAKVFP